MGSFDSNFNLPSPAEQQMLKDLDALSTTVKTREEYLAQVGAGATSFTMSGVTTKLMETGNSLVSTFGSSIPFDKIGANLPSFNTLAANALQQGSKLVGNAIGSVTGGINDFLAGSGGFGGAVAAKAGSIQNAATQGSASASQIKAGVSTVTSDHKVRLTDGKTTVTFDVMPEIVEAHTVSYEAVAPAQFPGSFQKYKGTDSVTWTLNIQLISRTRDEADENYQRLNTLRGWKQPFFGIQTGEKYPGMIGAPPPVLTLRGLRDLVGPVPVVITSLNWTWPKDVDYLPTKRKGTDGNSVPFPAVMVIAITMVESYSTSQFNDFDLKAYRAGNLAESFTWKVPTGDEGE